MRSDFLGDCDAFNRLPEAINRGQFLVPRLTRAQRRDAIVGPVRLTGGSIAPRLVDRLLNERLDTRDDLPILQHCLMRCWDDWSARGGDGPIDVDHYECVETIHRALNFHAQQALDELDSDDRDLARVLFQTITERDAGNRRIRRPAHLSEIQAVAGAGREQVLWVIERFRDGGRHFLMLTSERRADDPLVDISHESLIRQWQTLCGWVDAEAESARLYGRLAETAALEARREAGLYREADLEIALEWKAESRPGADWAGRYPGDFDQAMGFLDRSREARDRDERERAERQAERERLLKEKAELAEQQTRQEREARRKARRWTIGMAMLVLLTIGAALFAVDQWREATAKTVEAARLLVTAHVHLAQAHEEKALALLKEAEDSGSGRDYQRVWLQALEAQRQPILGRDALHAKARSRITNQMSTTLFADLWRSPRMDTGSSVNGLAYSPSGELMATAHGDGSVRLWDAGSGEERARLAGEGGSVWSVAFSPDGQLVASGSDDGSVRLWRVRVALLLDNGPASSPRAALISEALKRLWGLRIDGLDVDPKTWTWLKPRNGRYEDQQVTIDVRPAGQTADPDSQPIMRSFDIRPLFDPPERGEDKLDQLLRWLGEQDLEP